MKTINFLVVIISMATLALLTGCSGGGGSSGTPGNSKTSLKVVFANASSVSKLPAGVTRVMLNVQPANSASYTPTPLDVSSMTNVSVPSLTDNETYTFRIDAYNSVDTVIWQGSTTAVMVPAPAVNPISIVCNPYSAPAPATNTSTGTATATPTTTPTLSSIAVTPANPSKTVGATQQFTATGTYSDNSTADLTATVTWSSTSTTVATIATTGIATAVVAGSTTITASMPVTLPIPGSISGTTTLTVTSAVVTPSITLPKTGQTLCYDAAGAVIACAGTGQDGALLKGIAWPVPRFIDNADGTVTDNLTGLIWLKNGSCFATQWSSALSSANTLASGACGLTDGSTAGQWRLPNRKELQSLLDRSTSSPALPTGHPFTSAQTGGHWTASTNSTITSDAWVVELFDGSMYTFGKAVGINYVWPVKAGL